MPQDRKKNQGSRRSATIEHDPDPGLDEPVDELKLPSRNPTKGRTIEDPKPRTPKQADDIESPEDDDTSGEMAAAGQDLGVTVDGEREASSVEDFGVEDEEDDWIDHDDSTDRGRGTLD